MAKLTDSERVIGDRDRRIAELESIIQANDAVRYDEARSKRQRAVAQKLRHELMAGGAGETIRTEVRHLPGGWICVLRWKRFDPPEVNLYQQDWRSRLRSLWWRLGCRMRQWRRLWPGWR